MATAASVKADALLVNDDELYCDLPHPVWVNIRPILESVAGKLTDEEIDQWFVEFHDLNEGRGFTLELTAEGELIISPMVNRGGGRAEFRLLTAMGNWEEEYGGEAYGADANMRLPDGSRIRPDALWLSPEQVAALPPVSDDKAITVCPAFVAEIMSGTDTLPPLQRKMERYIANGAQLGWLIDPYRRRVYVYRPGVDVEILEDPEALSGEPVLPGFVFEVRSRIFALHAAARG
ncbi:MAG: Uma2 family endonuclease [Chloroflexota bacterium]|nr:Uma2 family endonuclease [Chloroflexota bacterium]MDE2959730.1 Uma2 family endonuclease [Chloroflexota bacterium]